MMTGISTACFYPLYTEEALAEISRLKVESAEIFFNCREELKLPMLKEMRRIADAGGVKILSLHPYMAPFEPLLFFSRYERRFKEGMELYKEYYEAANILNAELVVFHGGSKYAEISYGEYFEAFAKLVDDAIANGSNLCHENVERCKSRSPKFFAELSKAVPKARFVFDIKQAVRAGEDINEFARVMAGKIKHVHFSDHNSQGDCLLPGKGDFNTVEFLAGIRKNGFDGGVIVELYRENFGEIVELYAGYQQLCTQVSTALKNDEKFDKIRQTT